MRRPSSVCRELAEGRPVGAVGEAVPIEAPAENVIDGLPVA